MLETYFVKRGTLDRVRASWIGAEIESQRTSGDFGGLPHQANLEVA